MMPIQDADSGTGQPAPAAVIAVDRAAGDLRRGGMVVIADAEGRASLMLSPEYANQASLARLRAAAEGPASLVVTAHRAAALGLAAVTGPVVALPVANEVDGGALRDLADPTAVGAGISALPAAVAMPHSRDAAAVALAKIANLLPAAITAPLAVGPEAVRDWAVAENLLVATVAEISAHQQLATAALRQVSAAQVPLAEAEDARIVAFRPADGGVEHIAVIVGAPRPEDAVLTRLHSQCFTGDLLASLRCDCGDQLRGAIAAISAAGGGVLLYLAQEGRGIGLVNKLRAYQLQDQGYDTIDANRQLGFDADERHYRVAAEMLRQLGFLTVRLLTNNPDKLAALKRFGITVAERVPHSFPASGHNARYLAAKVRRAGHMI